MSHPPDIAFRFFPSLHYESRLWATVGLLGLGALLQLFLDWWVGAPCIIVAGCMLIPKGIDNRPEFGSQSDIRWEKVTDQEMRMCMGKIKASETWARKNNLGRGIVFLLILLFLAGIALMIPSFIWKGLELDLIADSAFFNSHLHVALGFDAMVLSFCLLLGSVRSWIPSRLQIHLTAIMNALNYVQQMASPSLIFEPMLEIMDTPKGKVPRDARLMIRVKNAPEGFLGIQIQVSTNTVQGTSFPYLYGCILAKNPLGLFSHVTPHLGSTPRARSAQDRKNKDSRLPTYEGCVVEMEADEEVDVVVVRQITFGTGYKTGASQQIQVVATCLKLAALCLSSLEHARVRIRPPSLPVPSESH